MRVVWPTFLLAAQFSFPEKPAKKLTAPAELVSVDKVSDRAPHSAFTTLVRFHERFFLAFREGASHASPDGAIRILSSFDGDKWAEQARLDYPVADLRDPKLSVTPEGKIMLIAGGAMHPPAEYRFKTFAWFSYDGREWTSAEVIGEPNIWLWRIVWHTGKALGFGYGTGHEHFLRTYLSSRDGELQVLNANAAPGDYPNESDTVFLPDDTAVCLLRRDGTANTALVGTSRPPYRSWTWKDLGTRIGGPALIRVPDGRLVAIVRLLDGRERTSLCFLNLETTKLEEFLTLPSGGDTSYAGVVWNKDLLHISYYSSHEGRTAVYFAKVKLNR
ncbi:MAG: exo-alpha-sialidase [Bryobacterales bacterium]|nr:exo-alpha-sialidase [Bryobacterales bacterium]